MEEDDKKGLKRWLRRRKWEMEEDDEKGLK